MFLFFIICTGLVASTELSDEAVFNRNSSESINARFQPRKPEGGRLFSFDTRRGSQSELATCKAFMCYMPPLFFFTETKIGHIYIVSKLSIEKLWENVGVTCDALTFSIADLSCEN